MSYKLLLSTLVIGTRKGVPAALPLMGRLSLIPIVTLVPLVLGNKLLRSLVISTYFTNLVPLLALALPLLALALLIGPFSY